jgi:hypothetical protein
MKNDKPSLEAGPEKHGQAIRAKVLARKAELEKSLEIEKRKVPKGEPYLDTTGLATALAVVEDLLTGNPDNIREPTATHLRDWLDSSRYLPPSHPKNGHSPGK